MTDIEQGVSERLLTKIFDKLYHDGDREGVSLEDIEKYVPQANRDRLRLRLQTVFEQADRGKKGRLTRAEFRTFVEKSRTGRRFSFDEDVESAEAVLFKGEKIVHSAENAVLLKLRGNRQSHIFGSLFLTQYRLLFVFQRVRHVSIPLLCVDSLQKETVKGALKKSFRKIIRIRTKLFRSWAFGFRDARPPARSLLFGTGTR
eukprot:CAMPEP_0113905166 /NCGR_PEP_ID=MMETSP0780_2-20120614/23817_1 /TAXON_ID=652834 /ORGANISM="Palpitomonas bilix" /LENGTH=201 /DNA_ID=CAMNT_0000899177 /DNA_START=47 /DNA_END=648 /DNA_ORIENTATION=+ /assembly_acc=CAM_ASM_000599